MLSAVNIPILRRGNRDLGVPARERVDGVSFELDHTEVGFQ
jgi:hypothetical protein